MVSASIDYSIKSANYKWHPFIFAFQFSYSNCFQSEGTKISVSSTTSLMLHNLQFRELLPLGIYCLEGAYWKYVSPEDTINDHC